MSVRSKIENITKNIEAINDKIEKLELQRKIYQVTLDKLQEKQDEQPAEAQDPQARQGKTRDSKEDSRD